MNGNELNPFLASLPVSLNLEVKVLASQRHSP